MVILSHRRKCPRRLEKPCLSSGTPYNATSAGLSTPWLVRRGNLWMISCTEENYASFDKRKTSFIITVCVERTADERCSSCHDFSMSLRPSIFHVSWFFFISMVGKQSRLTWPGIASLPCPYGDVMLWLTDPHSYPSSREASFDFWSINPGCKFHKGQIWRSIHSEASHRHQIWKQRQKDMNLVSFERNIASFRFANKLFLVEVLREYMHDMPDNTFFHFLLLYHPIADDGTSWIR